MLECIHVVAIAAVVGTITIVDLRLRLQGAPDGILRIRLGGAALPGGGLRMDRSAVTLGPPVLARWIDSKALRELRVDRFRWLRLALNLPS